MFRIKICGITNEDDARAAVDAGADAIGLNFYRKSRRFIDRDAAQQVAAVVPERVAKIGVFVNEQAAQIATTVETVGLDGVQLHGDERPELLAELPPNVVIVRAFRCGAAGLGPHAEYLSTCQRLGRIPDAVLIDADAGSEFGGTGRAADWAQVANDRRLLMGVALILAGGLKPANVAEAIAAVRPDGVDVASGVESSPRMKDGEKMRDFIATAIAAFAKFR